MYDDTFDFELENDARDQEYQWRLATHDQDYADNMECLALAVDYQTTQAALQQAYADKDVESWASLTDHMARIKNHLAATWPTLEAAILRGDYDQ